MRNVHPVVWVAVGAAGLWALQKFTGTLIPVPRSGQAPAAARMGKKARRH